MTTPESTPTNKHAQMFHWLNRAFSDATGEPDDARIAAFMMVLTFLGNSIVSVVLNEHHIFDAQAFGIGAGALAGGVGVWFGARKGN
ncbi:MAG TPA: hypothetical protein VIE17_00215 [Methylophilaceae bacterium]